MKQKLSYFLAGACSAALIFSFVLLPTVSHSKEETPNYIFNEYERTECRTSCNVAISCTGSCDEDEGHECCNAGSYEGSSCL